jgi:hypothetical protein
MFIGTLLLCISVECGIMTKNYDSEAACLDHGERLVSELYKDEAVVMTEWRCEYVGLTA